jgi:hypothetical protein
MQYVPPSFPLPTRCRTYICLAWEMKLVIPDPVITSSQIGPHAFLGEEAPLYPTGCKLILACSVTQMALAISLRMLLMHRNKKRDEAAAALGHEIDQEYTDGADLTDFENPHFRYVL